MCRNCWFVRLFPELRPNHAYAAATCAPDLLVACAVQEQRIKGFTDHYIKRGTDSAAHFMEDQGYAKRIANMACHLIRQAVLPSKIPAQRWPQCAGLIARRAVPSLRQMRPEKDFWSGGNTASGKNYQRPTRVQMLARSFA